VQASYLVLGRLREEDHEFEANLGYIARCCLKEPTNQQNKKQKRYRVRD
jgi:hypothetical protein